MRFNGPSNGNAVEQLGPNAGHKPHRPPRTLAPPSKVAAAAPTAAIEIPTLIARNKAELATLGIFGDALQQPFHVIIPDGTVEILKDAFNGCGGLVSATIPESVRVIGTLAFARCKRLVSVALPGVLIVQPSAFSLCIRLASVFLPSAEGLQGNVFRDCSALNSVTLPHGLRRIPDGLFRGCTGLKQVNLPESVVSIGSSTFLNCVTIEVINIPSRVEEISNYAFCGCRALTSLVLPASLRYLGCGAFAECTSLTSMVISIGVTRINDNTFNRCVRLTSVTLPPTLIEISALAFHNCHSLMSITIPNNVKTDCRRAFRNCERLVVAIVPPLMAEAFLKNQLSLSSVFPQCPRLSLVVASATACEPCQLPSADNPIARLEPDTTQARLSALKLQFWSPKTHKLCTESRKASVVAILLVISRLWRAESTLPRLPTEMWFAILDFLPII